MLPASAGMVPCGSTGPTPTRGAPRQRGDGPDCREGGVASRGCSPPARGWSFTLLEAFSAEVVLPASAGMVPKNALPHAEDERAPRQRGDGPEPLEVWGDPNGCSPPARGWSRLRHRTRDRRRVLPASAGMVQSDAPPRQLSPRAPRQRGDGPRRRPRLKRLPPCSPPARGWSAAAASSRAASTVLPASAGMVRGGGLV